MNSIEKDFARMIELLEEISRKLDNLTPTRVSVKSLARFGIVDIDEPSLPDRCGSCGILYHGTSTDCGRTGCPGTTVYG